MALLPNEHVDPRAAEAATAAEARVVLWNQWAANLLDCAVEMLGCIATAAPQIPAS
jgi:hypothetical protein